MLDRDLAVLYGVATGVLNQAVKRNASRFPNDFCFRLSLPEARAVLASRSQGVNMNRGRNLKYAPYAFTEQGVAMLASVLRTSRAVQISIGIVRAFVRLRRTLAAHQQLVHKLKELEQRLENHDDQLRSVFEAIRELMAPEPVPPKRRIGFRVVKE
jgi:hypothetical protein